MVPVGQEAAREGVEGVEGEVVRAQAGQELVLDGAVQGVVHALVDGGRGPAVLRAELAYGRDFPGHEVGDAPAQEAAFFVQLVYFCEGFFKGDTAIRTVQVPEVDALAAQGFQRREETCAQARGVKVRYGAPHDAVDVGVVLRADGEAAGLPGEGAEVRLGGAGAVEAGGVEFGVAVGLEGGEDGGAGGEVRGADLFFAWEGVRWIGEEGQGKGGGSTFFAKGHGAEDDFELRLWGGNWIHGGLGKSLGE